MRTLLFSALAVLLLIAPGVTASPVHTDSEDTSGACVITIAMAELSLVCVGSDRACVAGGRTWWLLTRDGTGCVSL